MIGFVLGIDIGGTGSRAALAEFDASGIENLSVTSTLTGPRVEIGADGSNVHLVAARLVSAAREAWPERFESVIGIGIGATGVASLSEDPASWLSRITAETTIPAALAVDAVTAHLGALGGRGGAVTVLGTGAIAIAHPGPDARGALPPQWERVDGWGHLFGDRGGGAWLGRHALEAALRCHDGVDDRGARLLAAATRRFGEPSTWPATFYTRTDRAGLLAEFAVDLANLARDGDSAAAALLAEAGREAARSAISAGRRNEDAPARLALTGGLRQAGETLVDEFRAEATRLRSETEVVEPAGDPLRGALTLASFAAQGRVSPQAGVLWA